MTQDYDELAKELLSLNLNMLHVPAKRKIGKMAQGEVFVLATHQQSAHPGELSKSMVVSSARIAALLGRMEEKQLISRTQDPLNNRQVIVTLLPAGQAVIDRIRAEVLAAAARMLERLGPEDAREYLRIQRKILSNSVSA